MIPIPIATSYRMRARPWVNYGLIAANVLILLAGWHNMTDVSRLRIAPFLLQPDFPQLYQFFTCMFLHAGWSHLLGNMLFLWVFGNALNDRLGHVGYLLFYLAGGIVAGLGYLLITPDAPVLGASGAIAAVTGAYLVLLPRTHVTVLLWFILIATFEVTSLFFLGLQIVWDFISLGRQLQWQVSGVAYAAHSSGYVFGIAVAAVLLAARLLPRDEYDLLQLLRHAYRRQQYHRSVREGFDPFTPKRVTRSTESRHVDARVVGVVTRDDTASGREIQLRRDIAATTRRGDAAAAVDLYTQIIQVNPDVVLPRQQQLDIANHLMSDERYAEAAEAYERFRRHFRSYNHMPDVQLMLGMIYGRYLERYQEAADLLAAAVDRLADPSKRKLAQDELAAISGKLNPPGE